MSIDNTKESILGVANKLFSRFGFHKTTMDEIAKIARKAKGSLYYHFASKEDLFREVVSIEMANLKNQLSFIVNNPDLNSSEKVKKYLVKRMEILNSAANYHETLKADFFEHFHFIDDLRIELDAWEKENLKKLILQGVETGEFAIIGDIDVLLDIFIMVIKGLEIPFFLQNKYTKYSPHFDGLIGILTKGLSL
ncbi:TetR/AcrR family transcriptional regulator [Prolixibacter denitrificans]|uniref:AcrR family transcriptional regulator n=1 Tax=Prolixibacter denitrificans TaxID=1541063 RepID=A0A2P8C5A9_9BACT|nr:TetR/AcrR family transcriptional regulator [Prolixibacter denitrificans]PSK80160.1 AcrR family transcriptional regulator [Prolixibacter denitrificans]GET23056.1 TetR family transcriptional regulator [Prolixibacter denitrificans]